MNKAAMLCARTDNYSTGESVDSVASRKVMLGNDVVWPWDAEQGHNSRLFHSGKVLDGCSVRRDRSLTLCGR